MILIKNGNKLGMPGRNAGRRWALLVAAFCLLPSAFATLLQFPLVEMDGSTNDTLITVVPVNNPVIYGGQYYWFPPGGTNVQTTNGIGYLNLVPGQYTASLAGIAQSWNLNVTNAAGVVDATGLSQGITFYSGVQSLTAGANIIITQSYTGNFTIASTASGGSSGTATNLAGPATNQVNALIAAAPLNYNQITNQPALPPVVVTNVAAGSNTVVTTSGGQVTISATVSHAEVAATGSNALNAAAAVAASLGSAAYQPSNTFATPAQVGAERLAMQTTNAATTNAILGALAANFASALTNLVAPGIFYVQTNGNDSTAVAGDAAHPWQSFTNALKAAEASAPALVQLGVGTFYTDTTTTNGSLVTTNITIAGLGQNLTLLATQTNYVSAGLVLAGDNIALHDLAIGTNTMTAAYYFPVILMNGTNLNIYRVNGYGDSDFFYNNAAYAIRTNVQLTVDSCVFYSGYDCGAFLGANGTSGTNSKLLFKNSDFYVNSDTNFGGLLMRGLYFNRIQATIANCRFFITNAVNTNSSCAAYGIQESSVFGYPITVQNNSYAYSNSVSQAGIQLNSATCSLVVKGTLTQRDLIANRGTVTYDNNYLLAGAGGYNDGGLLTNVNAASLTGTVPNGALPPNTVTNGISDTINVGSLVTAASGWVKSDNIFGSEDNSPWVTYNYLLGESVKFGDIGGLYNSYTFSISQNTNAGSGAYPGFNVNAPAFFNSGLTVLSGPLADSSGSFPAATNIATMTGNIPAANLTGTVPTNTVPHLLPACITGNAATASLSSNLVSGASLTNATFAGTQPTYLGNSLLTNAPSTNGFVTASITNGLATTGFALAIGANDTNYVNASTNGLIPLAVANLSATNAAKNATNTLLAPALVGLVPAAALPTGTVTNALSFSRLPYAYQARLAQARSKRSGLAFIGDSFTWGVGATQDSVPAYSNCYPELVFNSLPASYQAGRWLQTYQGQATTNGINILTGAGTNAYNGWAYVSVATWQVLYMNYPAVVSSNCSFSVTGYGTNAQLWLYGNNSPTNNHLFCVVDASGVTNVIAITNNFSDAASGQYRPYNVNLGAAGYHTVVCTVSNNQYIQFAGALLTWQTNGIILYNFGWPGHSLAVNDWQSPLTNFAPDMVFVCSGLNEWNTGLNTNTFATNVTSVVTNTLFVGGLPILMSEPSAWNTDSTNGKVLYNVQTATVANNYSAPFVDWWSLWSPVEATNTAYGLLNSSASSHPSNAGFISIGSFIFRQLIEPYITRDR